MLNFSLIVRTLFVLCKSLKQQHKRNYTERDRNQFQGILMPTIIFNEMICGVLSRRQLSISPRGYAEACIHDGFS